MSSWTRWFSEAESGFEGVDRWRLFTEFLTAGACRWAVGGALPCLSPHFPYSFLLCLNVYTVQFSSVAQSCPTLWDPWTAACQAFLSITNSWSLRKFMFFESVIPSNHLILCRPLLLLPCLSQHQGLLKRISSSHQVAKVLEFQLEHQSFQWIFRTGLL